MTVTAKRFLQVACIQNDAGEDWEKNLVRIERKVRSLIRSRVQLIALPEAFYFRGPSKSLRFLAHEVTPLVLERFQQLARRHHVAFLAGSMVEPSSYKDRFYNTSYLINQKGKLAARYRKIHLFDVSIKGRMALQESRHVVAGRNIVTGKVWGIPTGLTVCYDLRFPELFRGLTRRGSRVIFVPANFTDWTGRAHWEVLLRARAIENQVFIIAPGQAGIHPEQKIRSFGTSLIISPWGEVLGRGPRRGEAVIRAKLDFRFQEKVRRSLPALKHRRIFRG